ncbi:VOC family protein [Novosphingobium sp.]|uniref:VOC family protein n=1 Tax=Novosphingobium sp. TaxID=1874826 RepID=UPI0026132052|nr:VOC family protein [Novosphingobium sp.]
MTTPNVPFIWYELMTTDAEAAAAFYGAVVGWTIAPPEPGSPIAYSMIKRSDHGGQGGVLQLTSEMQAEGAHPAWIPYFHATDIDAAIAAVLADGGRQLSPRMDIPEGSFAMVTDPLGTPFYLMQPNPHEDRPDAGSDVFAAEKPQHVRWNELPSPDPEAAKAFYTRHFGMSFTRTMPMGEMGDYEFMDHRDVTLGAIMRRQNPAQPPFWTMYLGVPDIDKACAAISASGGTMMWGPHEVPGGEFSGIAVDPQGAMFGVVGPKGA